MKNIHISFETAKLAKEVGFTVTHAAYITSLYDVNGKLYKNVYNSLINTNEFVAPTQSLLQKWLREKHNIHIYVWFDIDKEYDEGYIGVIDTPGKHITLDNQKTYEESLEAALKLCLINIKDKIK